MTINEAISTVDRLRPNRFSREDKVMWLSELDALVWHDLIATHEQIKPCTQMPCRDQCEGWVPDPCDPPKPVPKPYPEYDESTPGDTVLLVKFPHDSIYLRWLESQIDLHNMEITKYNNSRSLFNNAYLTYTDWYNRTHMPKQVSGFRFTEGRKAGEQDALST